MADTLVSFMLPPMADISSIFNLLVRFLSLAWVEKYFELYTWYKEAVIIFKN